MVRLAATDLVAGHYVAVHYVAVADHYLDPVSHYAAIDPYESGPME